MQNIQTVTLTQTKAVTPASGQPIRSVFLVRVSSSVDKDIEHPQFFDPSYPLKYIQAGLERLDGVVVEEFDCWINPQSVDEMLARTGSKIGRASCRERV